MKFIVGYTTAPLVSGEPRTSEPLATLLLIDGRQNIPHILKYLMFYRTCEKLRMMIVTLEKAGISEKVIALYEVVYGFVKNVQTREAVDFHIENDIQPKIDAMKTYMKPKDCENLHVILKFLKSLSSSSP